MWPFRKTITFARSGILKGMTDCHSHLLPGVDDGVGTLDESLRILDMMEKHGVRKVWLTPHIMEDIPNETVTLQEIIILILTGRLMKPGTVIKPETKSLQSMR